MLTRVLRRRKRRGFVAYADEQFNVHIAHQHFAGGPTIFDIELRQPLRDHRDLKTIARDQRCPCCKALKGKNATVCVIYGI
jgi:hypothetical protein